MDEPAPGLAAEGDDLVVGLVDPVRGPIGAHELPEVLDRVQLGRSWRQGQQRDVFGRREFLGSVSTGLGEDENGAGARHHLRCPKMPPPTGHRA